MTELRNPMNDLKKLIREVPDFPKPGILFYDITTLLKDAGGLGRLTEALVAHYRDHPPDVIVGIEARGFMFAPVMASHLNVGFVPIRKPGKLPAPSIRVTYDLEYGSDCLEIHQDAIQPGQRVLIVDDLLATGGTALATCQLIEKLGGVVSGLAFVVELDFLKGRQRLAKYDIFSVLQYDK
jgi:adenine phosphoribosyltransferase